MIRKLVLSHPSGSSAEVYLNGAHVTSWIPAGDTERLFLSRKAMLENGKAIRGGIPVVFPQFADSGPLPKHGWLRTTEWEVDSARQSASSVTLFTEDTASTRQLWPHPYRAELTVDLDAESIEVSLTIINTGAEAFSFTSALHSYLGLADVRHSKLSGLFAAQYVDKTDNDLLKNEDSTELRISCETDRIYIDAPPTLRLLDSDTGRSLHITATGFPDTVVWNPWGEKTKKLTDMDDDEYLRMICVEAALVSQPLTLPPEQAWRGSQKLSALQADKPMLAATEKIRSD